MTKNSMQIIPIDKIQISDIVKALKGNGLVVAPSDTVYGLLVTAAQQKGVEKLIRFKNRPPGKAISVFVADFKMMEEYAVLSDRQRKIITELLPGPFTVILKSKHKVSVLLESEKQTLGLRIPDDAFIVALVKQHGVPVTATSANLAGQPPHYSVASLLGTLPQVKKDLIDLVIDAGKLPRHKPSTVIDLTAPEIKLLRKGDILVSASKVFRSASPAETKKIARYIFRKISHDQQTPLVFILKGEMGVGKTVFAKGIGELFAIRKIISPTYVMYYEYDLPGKKKFVHADLYNLEDPSEFRQLQFERYLVPGNILLFEWGERARAIAAGLKKSAKIIMVEMKYCRENEREITIGY
ncbi:threonylcarbamoyl-AMP synthase [Candidatus Roizmanbacteria bacterium]|nr:threonylcarbamoyl-AMP synthase [Candidatus Roizmanbacteria bacterium]